MPPCHTGEEAHGKKDDVLLVVQKEGTDRFHCQARTFLRNGGRKEAPASVDGGRSRPGPQLAERIKLNLALRSAYGSNVCRRHFSPTP